jgi:hypothetical protein
LALEDKNAGRLIEKLKSTRGRSEKLEREKIRGAGQKGKRSCRDEKQEKTRNVTVETQNDTSALVASTELNEA